MSIIGDKVSVGSTGTTSPYIRVTTGTSSGWIYIWKAYLYGFDKVPANLCKDWCNIPNGEVNFTNSPNITSVGDFAFYQHMGDITDLPDTIKEVGESAFAGVSNLTSLPSALEVAGKSSFAGCSGLALTALPSNLREINYYSFYNCSKLAITELPESLEVLGSGATYVDGGCFASCKAIPSILIHDGITSTPTQCFMDCTGITTADLPSTLSLIKSALFHRCSKLTTIYCRATNPPTMQGYDGFGTTSALAHVYVPAASVDAYKTATNWTKYASIISAIPT